MVMTKILIHLPGNLNEEPFYDRLNGNANVLVSSFSCERGCKDGVNGVQVHRSDEVPPPGAISPVDIYYYHDGTLLEAMKRKFNNADSPCVFRPFKREIDVTQAVQNVNQVNNHLNYLWETLVDLLLTNKEADEQAELLRNYFYKISSICTKYGV
jgi:hypothetical protein